MSRIFRDLLKQVGSGSHTSRPLSREEAAIATRMMLKQEATPAQIGAFMIAHRIKRPTAEEIAGMLDAYAELGPAVATPAALQTPVTILGCPYDGRSRFVPVTPIVALMLAAMERPVLMHAGTRMPTKFGLPLIEIWPHLGLPLDRLTLEQVAQMLGAEGLGFVYLPRHFSLAAELVPYREQLGKRPPSATLELMWSPYAGDYHTVVGYVHPPTESLACRTFALRRMGALTTVKGLEGSCDLSCNRTAIVGIYRQNEIERLLLHPRDFGLGGADLPLTSEADALDAIQGLIEQGVGELEPAALWSGGFYLWHCGASPTLEAGLTLAERLLKDGVVAQKLGRLRQLAQSMTLAASGAS